MNSVLDRPCRFLIVEEETSEAPADDRRRDTGLLVVGENAEPENMRFAEDSSSLLLSSSKGLYVGSYSRVCIERKRERVRGSLMRGQRSRDMGGLRVVVVQDQDLHMFLPSRC